VLEAQPEVGEALARGGRARAVRGSIELTPFGRDFCRLCLPVETRELETSGPSELLAADLGEPDAGEGGNPPG
jgi:hypothetical protein